MEANISTVTATWICMHRERRADRNQTVMQALGILLCLASPLRSSLHSATAGATKLAVWREALDRIRVCNTGAESMQKALSSSTPASSNCVIDMCSSRRFGKRVLCSTRNATSPPTCRKVSQFLNRKSSCLSQLCGSMCVPMPSALVQFGKGSAWSHVNFHRNGAV